MYKKYFVYKKYPDAEVSYKFYITYFKGNFNLSFEQSQVELMVTLKIPSLTDNAKRSANLNLWFVTWMEVERSYERMCTDLFVQMLFS
jgi:hypothetical protein